MFNYKPYINSLLKYMVKNGYTSKPYPKIRLKNEKQKGVFIRTGNYEPDAKVVNLYTYGRHPKDVLRSLAHEMIHHKQNIEGRLGEGAYSGQEIINDNKLIKLEAEAYLKGNISFRSWTETVNQEKDMLNEADEFPNDFNPPHFEGDDLTPESPYDVYPDTREGQMRCDWDNFYNGYSEGEKMGDHYLANRDYDEWTKSKR